MSAILEVLFWLVLSFMAADYTLGRALVRDPVRAAVAAVFAILFVVFVHTIAL